jgi:hypothetical protein
VCVGGAGGEIDAARINMECLVRGKQRWAAVLDKVLGVLLGTYLLVYRHDLAVHLTGFASAASQASRNGLLWLMGAPAGPVLSCACILSFFLVL